MRHLLLALFLCATPVAAQYNAVAGTSAAPTTEQREIVIRDDAGRERRQVEERTVPRDQFGNADSPRYDLAIDGAFEGQTITVLHLYSDGGFDFEQPRAALKQKGFSVYRFKDRAPSPKELAAALEKSCQLWVISGGSRQLTDAHVKVIKRFFDSGRGVYLWGDNAPYAEDANAVAKALFSTTMRSSPWANGQQVVGIQSAQGKVGLRKDHLITTGIEKLYEGHTIAVLDDLGPLQPLIVGSDGGVVAGYYDRDGKRAIVDGGFTRLYLAWDTAGTGRYVKNAAAWLANYERFGEAVAQAPKPPAAQ